MCTAHSIFIRSIYLEEWRVFKSCIQINVQSWRIESVWIRLSLLTGTEDIPESKATSYRRCENESCREIVAHDTGLVLYPLPSVAGQVSYQHSAAQLCITWTYQK